jgi:hypothetical protein
VSHDPASPAAHSHDCRNCGTYAPLRFCPNCGQDTALHPPSAWEFVHEFITHYVALEGKLWKTMLLLTLQPGRLTTEYLAGRKARYINPLRIYITASFIFFLLIKVVGSDSNAPIQFSAPAEQGASVQAQIEGDKKLRELRAELAQCKAEPNRCARWKVAVAEAELRFEADPKAAVARAGERMRANLPYAMFLLLPVFALLLKAVYLNRRRYYGEHLVFSLHLHAFWFFALLVFALVPSAVSPWVALAMPAYAVFALGRVYGGRWWAVALRSLALRSLALSLLYAVCLTIVLSLLMIYVLVL